MSHAPLQPLRELLDAAEAALDGDDAPAAAAAVQRAVDVCAALTASGQVVVDAAEVARLVEQHRRLLDRAVSARDHLAAQFEAMGRSRRAARAYGRR